MKSNLLKLIILAAATGVITLGCDVHVTPPATEVAVNEAPPPPPIQVDVQTPMPAPGYIWIGGVWAWGPGDHWVWERGHWDRPPHAGAVWVPHRYEARGDRRVFVRGGWR
jgi:hypothetical protein